MSVVDDYLSNAPEPDRGELERIRAIIKHVVPEAEEVISYGMPAFRYKGKYLIAYAAFKNHFSLFPGSEPVGALKDTLKDNVTGKGTIQFTRDTPLSEDTIAEIVQLSMSQIDTK